MGLLFGKYLAEIRLHRQTSQVVSVEISDMLLRLGVEELVMQLLTDG